MSKKPKLSEFPRHKTCPYIMDTIKDVESSYTIKSKWSSKTKDKEVLIAYDTETGEQESLTQMFVRNEIKDGQEFVKIYKKLFRVFMDLPSESINVLGYINEVLKPNKSRFLFQWQECAEWLDYTRASVFKGIGYLLEKDVIRKGAYTYEYYINPTMLFNGDRIQFVQTVIKDDKRKFQDAEIIEETKNTRVFKNVAKKLKK